MLQALRKRMDEDEQGFTLIELLVVVIIIGILAAIAIPVFLSQRERAWNSAAQSELRNAAVAQESYFTGAQVGYTDEQVWLEEEGFRNADNVTFDIVSADNTGYCMTAVHNSGGDTWYFNSDDGRPIAFEDGGSC